MLKKASLSLLLVGSFILLSTSPVFANTWEYITHGGYDAAVEAWKRVALIFSHSGYAGLFTVGVVVGLFAILAGTVMKAAFGLRINIYSFLPYYLTAAVVFLAFILPKDKLIIYDETLNRGPYEVDGVPRLIATIAGVINKTENAMIEVLATSGDPVQDYRYNPAGISFHALGSINTKQIPGYVYTSLYNYYEDCIVTSAEIGTYLTWEDVISGKYSFVETINVANNPSLFTTIYDSNGRATTLSCQEAAPIVAGYLTSEANFNSALRGGCARVGYDPDSTASFQQCKSMLANSFAFLAQSAGIPISANYLFPLQQMLFAEIANHYALMNGPEALGSFLATQRTSSTYLGLGIHANSWIPELKETLSAIAISITPVLLIFIVTPLGLKALSLIAGMFLWVAIWGVVDALVFSFGLSMASSSAKYLANASVTNGFGIFAATILPNVTAKIYAIFGALRWAGLMLASAISMMLVRFGGYALSMLAGQLTGIPSSVGAEVGKNLLYNPSESIMKSLAETGAWGNAAATVGGAASLIRGLANMQYASLTARGMTGNSYSPRQLLQSELSKLHKEISMHSSMTTGQAEEIGKMQASKELGNLANWEKFNQYLSSSSFGQELTAEDRNWLFHKTGGDIGKTEEILVGVQVLRRLGNILPENERQTLSSGDLQDQFKLFEKYKSMGMLGISTMDNGNYLVSIETGKGNLHEIYDPETGNFYLLDSHLSQISNFSVKGVKQYKQEIEINNREEIAREVDKILSMKTTDHVGQTFTSTFTKTREKILTSLIEQALEKDKELQEFLRNSKMNAHNLAIGLGFGKLGFGYQAKDISEKGVQMSDSLRKKLQNLYSEATVEAFKETLNEMREKGFSMNKVEDFLDRAGAKNLEALVRVEEFSQMDQVDLGRNLTRDFLLYRAQKEGITVEEAFFKTQRELAENPEEVYALQNQFLRDTIWGNWESKVISKGEEIHDKVETLGTEVKSKQESIGKTIAETSIPKDFTRIKDQPNTFEEKSRLMDEYLDTKYSYNLFKFGMGWVPFGGEFVRLIGDAITGIKEGGEFPHPGTQLHKPEGKIKLN